MSKEMLNAFAMLEEQKGIKSEIVIEAIEQAITAAYKRQYGQAQNVKVIFDEKKGNFNVYSTREVVDEAYGGDVVGLINPGTFTEIFYLG